MLVSQVRCERGDNGRARCLRDAQGLSYGRSNKGGVGEGCQLYGENPVGELVQQLGGSLQTQAGLTCAPWSDEGNEAGVRAAQQGSYGGYLFLASDQGGSLHGQVVGAVVQGLEGRELGGQIGRDKLEDALGAVEVF